jgi:hypothetical protein
MVDDGIRGTVFVVIALHADHAQLPKDLHAFRRVRVIPNHIADTGVMRASLTMCILENCGQRLQIRMDVSKHGIPSARIFGGWKGKDRMV